MEQQKPIESQIQDLLLSLIPPYRAKKEAEGNIKRYKEIIDKHASPATMLQFGYYKGLDAAEIQKQMADKEIEAALKSLFALLPKSLVADMRNNRRPLRLHAGLGDFDIWFENYQPRLAIAAPGL